MKKMFFGLLLLAFGSSALATVDGHDVVFLVVQDVQSEEFFVEKAPVIGCYGLPRGPQLVQFTAEYKVPSNIGCGGPRFEDNVNYLTCATITDSEESKDFSTFSKITLDISNCEAKNNQDFIATVKKAVSLNFSNKKNKVELTLVK